MNKQLRTLIAAGLSGVLVLSSIPTPAMADTADDLAVAAERLESLGWELEAIQDELDAYGDQLEACSYDIAQKQGEIAQTQERLASARQVLGERMRTSYKAGGDSLVSVILNATSFEDLVSRIYYMDKVAGSDAAAIEQVEGLQYALNDQMAALEATQRELERTLAATQERVGEYEQKVAEAASYYNSLDAKLQEELAAQAAAEQAERERAEAEAMARALEAAEQATVTTDEPKQEDAASKSETSTSTQAQESKPEASTTGSGSSTQPEEPKQEPAQEPAQETAQETPSENAGASQSQPKAETPVTNTSTSGTFGGAGVDSAYSCIGCPYVWGAAGPNSFDCSGLVCYCYGYGRGRTTYDMISSLKASGDWKTSMSQLSYGDLIFTSTGHVGIYLGNGTFIHAPAPGRTVRVQEVFSFVGGGTY